MAEIGFIGAGNMGGPMLANLIKAGHAVTVFDLVQTALDAAQDTGATLVGSHGDAAAGRDAVITMLPAGAHVREVYTAEGGVLARAAESTLLIDCSTIDVDTAREVASAAKARGLEAVDAPVSGGIAAANGGTLTFMVGGSADGFARAEPILADMGKAVIHAGDNGAGQAAKICNNMLLGATMAATCETFMLAKKLGLDLQTFYDISSKASGQSWSMTSYCPVPGVGPASPADNGYAGGFAAALMLKDMRLALEAAKASGARVPMGERAEAIYAAFVEADAQGLDFSAIITALD